MHLPDLGSLLPDKKDALIRALWAQVQALTARIAALKAKLGGPPKDSGNSSQPPSRDQKANREDKLKRVGPRQGSLGRKGGGRVLAANPDETVVARPACCAQCQAAFSATDHKLTDRYDKIELPKVIPVVTRVELYAKHAAPPRWRHCRRVWSKAARSASTSWRWRCIYASPTPSATNG